MSLFTLPLFRHHPSLRKSLTLSSSPSTLIAHQAQRRSYARLTVIGYLIKDAQLLTVGGAGAGVGAEGAREFVALKVASKDPLSKQARDSGREETSSVFDILSFNRQPYLSTLQKGSLIHAECDVRLEPTKDGSGNFTPPKVRLTLRDFNKLRNPASAPASSDDLTPPVE